MAKKKEEFFDSNTGHIMDRIIIHRSPDLPKEGLFLGVNGFQDLAQYDVEIDIPRPKRLMLDTRIITQVIPGPDGTTFTRDIRRVNYTLVKEDVGNESLIPNIDKPTEAAAAL